MDWMLEHHYFIEQESKTPRFLGFSFLLHTAAILIIAFTQFALPEKPKVETITIEIQDVHLPKIHIAKAEPKILPVPEIEKLPEPAIAIEKVEKILPPKTAKLEKNLVKKQSLSRNQAHRIAPPVVQSKAYQAPQRVAQPVGPETLDDIQAPDLDTNDIASTKSNLNPQVFDQDLKNDFDVINQRHKKSLENEKRAFQRQATRLEEEGDQNLAQAAQENLNQRQALAAANLARRNQELANIENAKAAEKAEALATEKARQGWLQETKQGLSNKIGQALAQEKAGQQMGKGISPNGIPNGVRDLSELKQRPGNPRPQYDQQERFQQQQGQISFLAYVTREGNLTQFRLLKSTGYRNLDSKTLRALKMWQFFPGQEGWVEIPFNWNLKGGPQEMPTLLRRAISRN